MADGQHPTNLRETVVLTALSADNVQIMEITLTYNQYYSGDIEVVDSDEYRRKQGIRHLHGEIFDEGGLLEQVFDNRYDTKGTYVSGKATFADGTVHED